MKIIDYLIDHLNQESSEGLILYFFGAITITIVHIKNEKDWVVGLKGSNGLWEAPEIALYIFFWIAPHVVMADAFLKLEPSTECWIFLGCLLLFALTGRWGLEWLLAFRGKQSTVSTIEKTETITTTEEKKKETT
jgi:hypothetical protein